MKPTLVFRIPFVAVLLIALYLVPPPGHAQRRRNFDAVEIKTHPVAGSVYMLEGSGGNIGVSIGTEGIFLVDDQFAPLTEKIVAAIRKLSNKDIRFLINTHIHGDHTGGNENFGKMGTLIFSHDAVRSRLEEGLINRRTGQRNPGSPREALPLVTYKDRVTFHLNGEEVQVLKVPNAHTDGDSIIHFKGSNVIHMGDVFRTTSYPFIDQPHGEHSRGRWKR
ncbi:MAG: MBL fold metallo-hydrolase [Deltaproteobacteria bacterium]|nr:MBL fold metallo-hydrolase [Deltaproteobacteria bacterium]